MMRFIVAILVSLSLVSCDPFEALTGHSQSWYIVNRTDRSVSVKYIRRVISPEKTYEFEELYRVQKGDSTIIHAYWLEYKDDNPRFDYLLKAWYPYAEWKEEYTDDVFIEVFSDSEELLKTWRLRNKDKPGRQFFDENEWRYFYDLRGVEHYYWWVFDIYSQDLE